MSIKYKIQMKSNRKKLIAIIVILGVSLLYFFMFTPLGVHTFDETLFGGKEAKSYKTDDYPTEINGTKPIARTIELLEEVKQPSGWN